MYVNDKLVYNYYEPKSPLQIILKQGHGKLNTGQTKSIKAFNG